MKNTLDFVKKLAIYLIGFLIIALGINVSKMSGLGISPVSSIPGVLFKRLGDKWDFLTLGNMVIVVYCILVLAQVVVLRRDFKLKNVLGVPVAIVFGWMVDLVGTDPNAPGHLLLRFKEYFKPEEQIYVVRFLYLVASIIIIGIGVFVYLKPKLVPMPAEGLALAISQKANKPFGNCKTVVDFSLILIALVLQMILLDGFGSFFGEDVVVREGTILSAICVGQVVKLLNRIFTKKH